VYPSGLRGTDYKSVIRGFESHHRLLEMHKLIINI
jgi:hypothetical protein